MVRGTFYMYGTVGTRIAIQVIVHVHYIFGLRSGIASD